LTGTLRREWRAVGKLNKSMVDNTKDIKKAANMCMKMASILYCLKSRFPERFFVLQAFARN